MSSKYEDARLILKLYELRREPVMREARNWFAREFHPKSVEDIFSVLRGEKSAYLRMITSYWEMAATLVLHGAIDQAMFTEANGEHLFIFARIEPFLEGMRQGNPSQLRNLEKLVRSTPNADQILKNIRERMAAASAARS